MQVQCFGGGWLTVYARDVSASGFGFHSPVAFQVGELIGVSFPDVGVEAAAAVVRHVKREGYYYVIGAELEERLDDHSARAVAGR